LGRGRDGDMTGRSGRTMRGVDVTMPQSLA
jgi:hypothetical protein